MSPDVGLSRSKNRWTSPDVARCRWTLAPRLAPSDIVSNANVRIISAVASPVHDPAENFVQSAGPPCAPAWLSLETASRMARSPQAAPVATRTRSAGAAVADGHSTHDRALRDPRSQCYLTRRGKALSCRIAGVALVHGYARISMIIRCPVIPPEAYGQAPEPIPRRADRRLRSAERRLAGEC